MTPTASARLPRLTTENLAVFIGQTAIALAVFDHGRETLVPASVIAHFRATYGGHFGVGRLELTSLPYDTWIAPYTEAVRPRGSRAGFLAAGLYLFVEGRAVAHHSGVDITATMLDLFNGTRAADVESVAQDILTTFDPFARNFMLRNGTAPPRPPPPAFEPPPVEPAATAPADPYAVLGVTREASLDEIRRAFKSMLAANHPDRVAHLDPAFAALANERARLIKAAYDMICRERG